MCHHHTFILLTKEEKKNKHINQVHHLHEQAYNLDTTTSTIKSIISYHHYDHRRHPIIKEDKYKQ